MSQITEKFPVSKTKKMMPIISLTEMLRPFHHSGWLKAIPDPLGALFDHRLPSTSVLQCSRAQACGSALIREEQRERAPASRAAPTPRRARGRVASPAATQSQKCTNTPRSRFPRGPRDAGRGASCSSYSASPESPTAFRSTPASLCRWDADNLLQLPYRCPPLASTPFPWRNTTHLGGKIGRGWKYKLNEFYSTFYF